MKRLQSKTDSGIALSQINTTHLCESTIDLATLIGISGCSENNRGLGIHLVLTRVGKQL